MSNELGGITNASIRNTIGDRSYTDGGLVIGTSSTSDAKTVTVAIVHTINGVFQTALAAAEFDLSGLTVLSAKDGSTLDAAVAIPVLAAGDDPVTKVWILACAGDNAYIVEPELSNASQDLEDYKLSCPAGYAPFGAIEVICTPTASVGVVTFVLGTTAMTGVTGQVVDFFDLAVCPPTLASLIEL